jgi:methylase of polypeptide subunit release factors
MTLLNMNFLPSLACIAACSIGQLNPILAVAEVAGPIVLAAQIKRTIQANDLTFITDFEQPQLSEGEIAVFSYSDEATILLENALQIKESRGSQFGLVIDPFCGDGKSGLPMLHYGISTKLLGSDINPRAIQFAMENAKLNHLEENSSFSVSDITKDELPISDFPGNTLWIANPPFALKAKGANLEVMRDGGENGLVLTMAFVSKALQASKPGDTILGIGYSRIQMDGTLEMEKVLKRETQIHGGHLRISLLAGQKLWRGVNGKKEQDNPMFITEETFALKANPENQQEVDAYRTAAQFHIKAGYDRLGYYCYVIQK